MKGNKVVISSKLQNFLASDERKDNFLEKPLEKIIEKNLEKEKEKDKSVPKKVKSLVQLYIYCRTSRWKRIIWSRLSGTCY